MDARLRPAEESVQALYVLVGSGAQMACRRSPRHFGSRREEWGTSVLCLLVGSLPRRIASRLARDPMLGSGHVVFLGGRHVASSNGRSVPLEPCATMPG